MPIEIRNPAAPDQIVATYDETPDNTLDEVVARARATTSSKVLSGVSSYVATI